MLQREGFRSFFFFFFFSWGAGVKGAVAVAGES